MSWYAPLLFPPRMDWLQVEITTHCNAACRYCPRTLYAPFWQSRHMEPELYYSLKTVLKKTDLIYLQGWGEPLTHPQFFDFVRFGQNLGCQVGTTTNGLLLKESLCRQIVASGLDILALSLAGIDQANDHFRQGTHLTAVLDALTLLNQIKEEHGLERPAVHIAYLLLRSQIEDLPRLPDFFAGQKVDMVVLSTLDLIGSPELSQESIVPQSMAEYEDLCSQLEATLHAANKRGVNMHAWLTRPVAPGVCSENIDRAAVIGVDGTVHPCVYAGLPVSGDITHWPGGERQNYRPLAFGNIRQTPFSQIWRSQAYSAFRRSHHRGQPPVPCVDCVRRRMDLLPQIAQ
nr:SPASM domain-containing protein [uncultured Desulfobulbus sp.]